MTFEVGIWLYFYVAVIIEEVPLPNIGTSEGLLSAVLGLGTSHSICHCHLGGSMKFRVVKSRLDIN